MSNKKETTKKQFVNHMLLEIQELQYQFNDLLLELINLAEKNTPQFWVRFQKVYPNFTKYLLSRNPTLIVSELALCAYLYLGFSSKEISEFTFSSYKTIENNRRILEKDWLLTLLCICHCCFRAI